MLAKDILPDPRVARIALMGTRRSGKTSIERVVFHKMSPHECLFIEPTHEIEVVDVNNNPLMNGLQIIDFPGAYEFIADDSTQPDPKVIFKACRALVLVIDIQDEPHTESIEYIVRMIELAYAANSRIKVEVIIHKVDGDSDIGDIKMSAYSQKVINESVTEHLRLSKTKASVRFFMTSIYDHTIFEAFSSIVQKLIPQASYLANLLDTLSSRCDMEKTFLFDVLTKIYLATDSNPFDMSTYELCSDMVDVVIDVSCIYGLEESSKSIAFDKESSSVIRLSSGYVVYLREVSNYLALVCVMREKSFAKSGLVEYNLKCFKDGLADLFSEGSQLSKV